MKNTYLVLITLTFLFQNNLVNAQLFGKKKNKTITIINEVSNTTSIKKVTKSCTLIPGLFPIYQDTTNGKHVL